MWFMVHLLCVGVIELGCASLTYWVFLSAGYTIYHYQCVSLNKIKIGELQKRPLTKRFSLRGITNNSP
jgi:hypothetical protein